MEIPEIDDTGSSGRQIKETNRFMAPVSDEAGYVADTIQGLAASNPRSMGSSAGSQMLAAFFSQQDATIKETKAELKNVREHLSSVQNELSERRTENAVLREQLRNATDGQILRNIMITIGTLLFGISVDISGEEIVNGNNLLALLGAILAVLGWFTPRSQGAQ